LEFVLAHFVFQVFHAHEQALFGFAHGAVVNAGADFLEDKTEQVTGRNVADFLLEIVQKVALDAGIA
jgi:hypothetical protein